MKIKDKNIYYILLPYCKKIRDNGRHFVCYPKNSDKVITVSRTSNNNHFVENVYHDFLKVGIDVKELKNKGR
jgi:hypothetical protein